MVPFAWLLPLFRSELLSLEAEYVAVGNEYFNEWMFSVTRAVFLIDLNAVRWLCFLDLVHF